MDKDKPNRNVMTVMAARNGFTLRTRSGVYVCKTVRELVNEVEAMARVMQKEVGAGVELGGDGAEASHG